MYLASKVLSVSSIFRAALLWFTIRASPRFCAASSRSGMQRLVRRKCEVWLVCIWMSQPSSVDSSPKPMIPALLQSTSRPSSASRLRSFSPASRTLLKLVRLHSIETGAGAFWCLATSATAASACSARPDARLSMITFAPSLAHVIAQILPVPVVQPVIATVLPLMDGRPLRNSGKCFAGMMRVPSFLCEKQQPIVAATGGPGDKK
mmetsp:Transcript_39839/g.103110  ORF Transcript_39839/g.103110 Transcript_39839/m.103110 type:complete len:206 (-) Transcript_39839:19-636(-)